jgi:hypothetical protein
MRIVSSKRVECATDKPLVYDLTVQKHGCYRANGFLVSNCDAFRMMAVAYRREPGAEIAPISSNTLMAGPENKATLNEMWEAHTSRKGRILRI